MSYYENKEIIKKLENKVTFLENKISKLEELVNYNIEKKYFKNTNSSHLYNINYLNVNEIPFIKRMHAFNYSTDNNDNTNNADNTDNTNNADNIGNNNILNM